MRPRHIVHIVDTLGAGGVQKVVLGLARVGVRGGDRHSVLCMTAAEGELTDAFRDLHPVECRLEWPSNIPVVTFRLWKLARDRAIAAFPWRLAYRLRRMQADLVHTHYPERVDLQVAGARKAGVPIVWTIHGMHNPKRDTREWAIARRLGSRHGMRITADSGPVADDYVSHGLCERGEIDIVHAGADVAAFLERRPRDPAWRLRHGIPADAILFGTSGRLAPAKAHDVLVAATAQVIVGMPRVHVAIAGDGPLRQALVEAIARAGLVQHVHLLGFQSDVPAFLNELDVFVLPSRSEGFPLALIEAAAAGLPCIASRVGGIADMLGAEGGVLIDPDVPDQLASAMTRMLDAGERSHYAVRGPSVATAFSYEACAARFNTIYASLLR